VLQAAKIGNSKAISMAIGHRDFIVLSLAVALAQSSALGQDNHSLIYLTVGWAIELFFIIKDSDLSYIA
jgi:hypothetical protein